MACSTSIRQKKSPAAFVCPGPRSNLARRHDVNDPIEVAWAAGLFEGEGCFTRSVSYPEKSKAQQRRIYLIMNLGTTDLDVLERFHAIIGVGRISGPSQRPGWKPCWRWSVQGKSAVALATNEDFLRHLGSRRQARLQEILAEIAAQPPLLSRRELNTHCRNGHAYEPDNIIWRKAPRGIDGKSRHCKTCWTETAKKRTLYDGRWRERKRLGLV